MVLHHSVVGTGRPLVVLPSFSLDGGSMARVFEPVFERCTRAWAAQTARAYVDLPGTGTSPPADATSDAVLDAVLDTIDAIVGGGAFSLAGWSYGGYLALGVLRRRGAQVRSALLVCTGTRIRPVDRDLRGTLPSIEEDGWLAAAPPSLHDHLRLAVGRQSPAAAAAVARLISANAPTDDAYLALLRREGFALGDERQPTGTEGPVVMLAGRRDRVAGYRSLVDALPGFPQADLLLSATAGHYLPVEEPDVLALAVERWTA